MFKVISLSLSPNTEKDDVALALRLIFTPWQWKKGKAITELEKAFKNKFNLGPCFSFNSGRSCLLGILEAIQTKEGDEVIIQSFTCNAVVNPILKFKAKAIYVDIGQDLNIDVSKIEEKINSKTKAIIAQHTFGMPSDIENIRNLCQKHNLILIEDCAHSLGAKINEKYCGSFGDFSFFSFGRDKVISSVYGGMVAVNNPKFLEKIKDFQKNCRFPYDLWTLQQLLHPVLTNLLILPFYNVLLGKIVMALSINLNILSKSVTQKENIGILPSYFPYRLPNGLAILALNQLRKLDRFNAHRKELAEFYKQELANNQEVEVVYNNISKNKEPIYLKYPLINKTGRDIFKTMRASNIYLNDGWRDSAIMPPSTNLGKMDYVSGSCHLAEQISKQIFHLPTHINISINDAKKIIYLLKP